MCERQRTFVAYEAAALGQRGYELLVKWAGDARGAIGPVDGLDAGKGLGLALGEKFGAVGGCRLNHAADLGDGSQCIVSAGDLLVSDSVAPQ